MGPRLYSGGRSITRFFPILSWLPRYDRAWLRPDLIAGIAVWALVAPQSIAYSELAGLPPEAGLVATTAALVGYLLLGTSRQLIVGPTSSTAIISAALVTPMAAGDPTSFVKFSAALAIVCAFVFVLLGLLKLGFVSQFISPAVQVGMMFGLGLTVISGQIGKLLGLSITGGTFVDQTVDLIRKLGGIDAWTAAVGISSLLILLVLRRFLPNIPAAFVVVAGAIVLSLVLDLENRGVVVVGDLSRGSIEFSLPLISIGEFAGLLPGALVIVVVSFAESNSVVEQFASQHRYRVRPNQELLALGAANGLAGLFQGFVVGGGASQSAANDRAGARSQISGLVVAALTLVTLLFLLPVFSSLPTAVLGAIIISAVFGFLRVRELDRIRRIRQDSYLVAGIALVGVLILGIMPGLMIGVALSILNILSDGSRPSDSVLGRHPRSTAFVDVERSLEIETVPGVLIYRLNAPIMFINAEILQDRIETRIAGSASSPNVVVIDMAFTNDLDIKGVDALNELRRVLDRSGIDLWLTEVRAPVAVRLQRARAMSETAEWQIYPTVLDAVNAYLQR